MNKSYQYNYSEHIEPISSMYDEESRINKANKTISILKDYFKDLSNLTLLDIGASTGIMTYEYAKHFYKVIGIDIDSQAIEFAKKNFTKNNIEFVVSPVEESNLNENSFDVITCSHIYEHVPSAEILMENIYKLLKPGGICYFAAGNRFKIIETHYRLPFLSYLPKKLSNIYLRMFTNKTEYYENLLSYRNLKKLVKNFQIIDYTKKIIKEPSRFFADEMIVEKSLKYYAVNILASLGYFLIPTYVWVLKKPN